MEATSKKAWLPFELESNFHRRSWILFQLKTQTEIQHAPSTIFSLAPLFPSKYGNLEGSEMALRSLFSKTNSLPDANPLLFLFSPLQPLRSMLLLDL
ncbi:hypothetical protein AAG906_036639 [Vitis piasezkii]